MNIEKIQKILKDISEKREWSQFHSPKNLSMALSVEASELVEIFQWLSEEDSYNLSKEKKEHLEEEIADITTYLLRICMQFDINLEEAVLNKIGKFEKKYPVNKSKGTAKKYTEL